MFDHDSTTIQKNFFDLSVDQTPEQFLQEKCDQWSLNIHSEEYARKMDECDPLRYVRNEFFYPKMSALPYVDKDRVNNDDECIYLCGQSLGLMPKRAKEHLLNAMNDWATLGVYGHYIGKNPWAKCDYPCLPEISLLVGGSVEEVGVMNQLSTNLHFMMGETFIRTEDIIEILKRDGKSIALVMMSGVHYYTGQLFDMEAITHAAHEQGCIVGFDLAHAVGNVPLKLHDWNVDFAVWCTYKYLNSGAGCIGGLFVHSNNFQREWPQLHGWWGNKASTRFKMLDDIDREIGANGYRISNPSIHQCAVLAASMQIFEETGIDQLRSKSLILTQYLQHAIEIQFSDTFTNLTPTNHFQRGAQISLRPKEITAQQLHDEMEKMGVVIDIRDDIIRIAPVPLYNSFYDVYRFITILRDTLAHIKLK
ncbi:unnamed protein product [Didymodactylos carnosus]|uniref:Kynureninase n=1 Tax=Didymodactylos carnosus TaxID=1234261 RepID=A0A814D7Y7_9BILA|nr:unnamed protein product [Didymodactylos carnosus]CAF0950667.1 unnamed protein product [Didymodactylos carnosus]CAF3690271.1 unnamed protein product [Didymodactylos carnosus]CAF3726361.1 unnamed protein product [Didymodactylos carnosus]